MDADGWGSSSKQIGVQVKIRITSVESATAATGVVSCDRPDANRAEVGGSKRTKDDY
jgi:hypothetical protein